MEVSDELIQEVQDNMPKELAEAFSPGWFSDNTLFRMLIEATVKVVTQPDVKLRVKECLEGHQAEFQIKNQYFKLAPIDKDLHDHDQEWTSEQHALWYAKMLKRAFSRIGVEAQIVDDEKDKG